MNNAIETETTEAVVCKELLGIGDRLKLCFDNFEAVWHVKQINNGVVTLARNGSNMAIDWSQLFLGGLVEHLRRGGAVKMPNEALSGGATKL